MRFSFIPGILEKSLEFIFDLISERSNSLRMLEFRWEKYPMGTKKLKQKRLNIMFVLILIYAIYQVNYVVSSIFKHIQN